MSIEISVNKLIFDGKRVSNILFRGPLLCSRIVLQENIFKHELNDENILFPINKRATIIHMNMIPKNKMKIGAEGEGDTLKIEPHIYHLSTSEMKNDSFKDLGVYSIWHQLTVEDWLKQKYKNDADTLEVIKHNDTFYLGYKVITAGSDTSNFLQFTIEYIDNGTSETSQYPEFCELIQLPE